MHESAARAASFIEAHGDATARLRADALLGRADADQVLARLAPDCTASLARALAIGDDLRALSDAHVRGWTERLAASCAPDGGWEHGAPLEVRLFTTGMIGGHLAKTRWARSEVINGAADFLARHWTPDRVQGGSWRAIAAHAHLFANTDHELADAVLQWCGRELGRGFATGLFDAAHTARVLVHCDTHALPGSALRAPDLVAALLAEQRADGGWPAWVGEGERDRVEATLDALVALIRLGQVSRSEPKASEGGPLHKLGAEH